MMERKDDETASFELRGAGGKLRKAPNRRPSTTPYARPQQNQAQRGRWLSNLVDPAFRLISGGASLILPSFFSKSESVIPLPALCGEEDDHDNKSNTELEQNAAGDNDADFTSNHVVSRSTEVAGPSRLANRSKSASEKDRHEEQNKVGFSNCNGVSEIEQLIREKKFSRDEINRLLEIVHSRAVDVPDVEQEKNNSDVVAEDVQGRLVTLEYSGKTKNENQEGSKRAVLGTSRFQGAIVGNIGEPALETSRNPTKEKHDEFNTVAWGTSTPHLQSSLEDDVGTSPVAIAKAYMENRALDLGFGSKSLISKDKMMLQHGDEVASKSPISLPSPKSSTCWPGAMVQDQRGYTTPQSQSGRLGLHNFPRTPYSRSIGSRSGSKLIQLQHSRDRHLSTASTSLRQSQTSVFGQVNSRGKTSDYGRGSVGPIRRVQRNVMSEAPERYSYFRSSVSSPTKVENSNVSEGIFSVGKKNLQGTNSSGATTPTVPPHSSQTARKILEHLERNPPTPKDKSAELKLATSWKKPPSSYATTSMANNHSSSSHLGGLGSLRKSENVQQKSHVHWSEDREHSIFMPRRQEAASEVNAVVNNNSSASDKKVVFSVQTRSNDLVPSLDFKKSQDSQLMSTHEAHHVSNAVQNAAGFGLPSLQKKPLSHTSGTKPILPSISIGKPDRRLAFSSDNSSGFTFPISAPSSVLSEPPTPSILPSFSAGDQHDTHSIPSYSFGSKSSTPALVFSFPSTSSAHTEDDSSDLKFTFGSEKSTRISFSSIDRDAICY